MSWRNNSSTSSKDLNQIQDWCAVRIIPYIVDKDKIFSILLGKDKKFKEWTPFGGSCNDSQGSCSRKDTTTLKKCLARELSEESKELIDLDKQLDFVNCKYINYVVKLAWANMHNNIYFSQWIGSDKETIINSFNNKDRDIILSKKLLSSGKNQKSINSYFEMDTIEFIPITHEVFGSYIYNSIQDFYKQEKSYRGDKAFYNQISDTFSTLFKKYPKKENGNTDGKRFDPRFLLGLIESISDYFSNRFKYSHIDDIVDDVVRYINGIRGGCSLDMSKNDLSQTISSDDTPLVGPL